MTDKRPPGMLSFLRLVLQSRAMPTSKRGDKEAQHLLKKYLLHAGLYARVARRLGVDASYVSRVAKGERMSQRILAALVAELRRIEHL